MSINKCPGRYCGRVDLGNNTWSECGACPRGFRTNGLDCLECTESPEFYDWLYLFFMILSALLLHWFFIDHTAAKKTFTKEIVFLHLSALFEVTGAALCATLLVEPMWTLGIKSCRIEKMSDWYTLFHNPNPNYEVTLHCTQEAVYPLYSVVFKFYALASLAMLLLRTWIARNCKFGSMTIYAGLYFYPILSLVHALFSGIIYYTYPYVVIVGSLISIANHLACKEEQTLPSLTKSCFTNVRDAVILLGHWLLHAYGIVAVTQLKNPLHYGLLALVPLPTIFYVLTSQCTDPNKLHLE